MRETTKVFLNEIIPFSNDKYEGIKLRWSGNTGFGEYTIYRNVGEEQWKADSGWMDKNDDKSCLKELLRQMVDMIDVEE